MTKTQLRANIQLQIIKDSEAIQNSIQRAHECLDSSDIFQRSQAIDYVNDLERLSAKLELYKKFQLWVLELDSLE